MGAFREVGGKMDGHGAAVASDEVKLELLAPAEPVGIGRAARRRSSLAHYAHLQARHMALKLDAHLDIDVLIEEISDGHRAQRLPASRRPVLP